ncbi:hypothetical protein BBJ28_00008205 [Nothophytophthora sp. Chile5]|nr:hypothetical protein BBJ28_00008205 [Nothophytophthora sp. Chile5]
MVFAPRPARPTFTSAQVTGFYFQPCRDDYDEVILEYFRCRCGTVRKQTRRNGQTNLMQHVRREHPSFEAEMLEATTGETGSLLNYVRRTSQNFFGWLLSVISSNLLLSFCENRTTRRYTTLNPICVETLRATMEGVVLAVERSIASEMPDIFGLIIDGWSHMSEHYLAVFAFYEVDGKVKIPLPCMAPLLNEEDDDLSARAHREFLAYMLPRDFAKQLHHLRPVIRQATRWSSTFAMVHRYFQLLEHLGKDDDDIAELLPSPACNRRLRALHTELKDVESVSKGLQGADVNLLDAREWFDGLIAVKPQYAAYIGLRANIVHSPDFVSGCVCVLQGSTSRLTRAEKAALRPFAVGPAPDADEEESGSFIERLQKRRRLAEREQEYALLRCIPPTSNTVERFFSVARVTFGHERNSLHPLTLEQILFLRQNATYWDVRAVDSIQS